MLKKTFLKKIKTLLLAQKKELYLSVSTKNASNDVDMDGDEIDEIQGSLIVQLSDQLNLRNKDKLSKIEEALQKIENQTYGLCEECGEEIAEKRLLFNPHFLSCIDCAESREINFSQRRRA